MKKIFNIIGDITLGLYLGQVIFMLPFVVLIVWVSDRFMMGYQDFTIKDAISYTWKTWNEIRTKKNS